MVKMVTKKALTIGIILAIAIVGGYFLLDTDVISTRDGLNDISNAVKDIENSAGSIGENAEKILESAELSNESAEKIIDASETIDTHVGNIEDDLQTVQDAIDSISGGGSVSEGIDTVQDAIEGIDEELQGINEQTDVIKEEAEAIQTDVQEITDNIQEIQEEIENIIEQVEEAEESIENIQTDLEEDLSEVRFYYFEKLGIEETPSGIVKIVNSWTPELTEKAEDYKVTLNCESAIGCKYEIITNHIEQDYMIPRSAGLKIKNYYVVFVYQEDGTVEELKLSQVSSLGEVRKFRREILVDGKTAEIVVIGYKYSPMGTHYHGENLANVRITKLKYNENTNEWLAPFYLGG